MRDTDLYAQILGVKQPWRVRRVELKLEGGEVEVFVEHGGSGRAWSLKELAMEMWECRDRETARESF